MRLRSCFALPLLVSFACGQRPDAELEQLRATVQPVFARFQQSLQKRLTEALAKGGPAHAVLVCRIASPEIAASVSKDGLWVRRVSAKTRNPGNRPDEFEARILARWQSEVSQGKSPVPVAERDGARLRVMQPILVGSALCLNCHGPVESLGPELRAVLKREYPDDQAVGYRLGDLRGAFSAVRDAAKR